MSRLEIVGFCLWNIGPSVNSALRPRRVDAELDPGGRGKELVGEGLNTLRARLATMRARLDVQN